jgi:hypothetical protein
LHIYVLNSVAHNVTVVERTQSSASVCRPWNYGDYLQRLSSFKSSLAWFAKPSSISPLECALIGWSCDSSKRDTLICTSCHATLIHDTTGAAVVGSVKELGSSYHMMRCTDDEKGEALLSRLTTGHSAECGWRSKEARCDASFREIPGLLESERAVCGHIIRRAAFTVRALTSLDTNSSADNLDIECPAAGGSQLSAQLIVFAEDVRTAAARHGLQAADDLVRSGAALPGVRDARSRSTDGDNDSGGGELGGAAAAGPEDALVLLRGTADLGAALLGRASFRGREDSRAGLSPLLQGVMLLALHGWQLRVAGPQRAAGTGGPSNNGDPAGSAAAPAAAQLWCQLCGRAVPVPTSSALSRSEGERAALDVAAAHRHFCPYVNPPALSPPWLQNAQLDGASTPGLTGTQLGACAFSLLVDGRWSCGTGLNGCTSNEDDKGASPEQAYKRIRSVLRQI